MWRIGISGVILAVVFHPDLLTPTGARYRKRLFQSVIVFLATVSVVFVLNAMT